MKFSDDPDAAQRLMRAIFVRPAHILFRNPALTVAWVIAALQLLIWIEVSAIRKEISYLSTPDCNYSSPCRVIIQQEQP